MYDDNLDALAAEYVLGTLSAAERDHAETMLKVDVTFAEIVRQWERRLGELNVMIETVEPPPEVWDKIKSEVEAAAGGGDVQSTSTEPAPPPTETETEGKAEVRAEGEEFSPLSALASRPPVSEEDSGGKLEIQPDLNPDVVSGAESAVVPPSPIAPKIERTSKKFYLVRRLPRGRPASLVAGTLALLLGLLIGRFLLAPAPARAPATSPGRSLVAVLGQAPTRPAFLLAINAAGRTLTVRTVSARPEAGHSYELWLLSPQFSKPRSLGIVGGEEFTQRPLPGDLDLDTIEAATYEISFEPAGGAKSDTPTGPILFTGTMVDLLPASPLSQ